MDNKLEMRKLQGGDVFPILRLMGKLNLRDDVLELVSSNKQVNAKTAEDQEAQGVKMFANIVQKALDNIDLIDEDLNGLLARLADTEVDTIKSLPVDEYFDMVLDFFEKPELKNVFKSTAQRFKKTGTTNLSTESTNAMAVIHSS